jgi:hypothetical protein
MTGDTVIFRRGSKLELQGQFKDSEDEPIPLTGIVPSIYETWGSGMQDATVSVTDSLNGKFVVMLPTNVAKNLPLGRSSWFKVKFAYTGSSTTIVWPPVWLDTR